MRGRAHKKQVAALPWRRTSDGLEVLLVNSRETKRWIIPKGWPMKGKTDAEAAAQEALEEAGAAGEIAKTPFGFYHYLKKLSAADGEMVRVDTYLLAVNELRRHWPEDRERQRQWFAPEMAADCVQEPELKALITRLAQTLRSVPVPRPEPLAQPSRRAGR